MGQLNRGITVTDLMHRFLIDTVAVRLSASDEAIPLKGLEG